MTRYVYSLAVLLTSILSVACGRAQTATDAPADEVLSSQAVVLTAVPNSSSTVTYENWDLAATSDSAVIRGVRLDPEASTPLADLQKTLTVPGAHVTLLERWEVSGADYLIVGTVDSSDVFELFRYHDSSGDGFPDASTETSIFGTSPSKAYVTSIAKIVGSDDVFVLDRRCQDILLVKDSNNDGWPNALNTAPFAKSDDHSNLLNARALMSSTQSVVIATGQDFRSSISWNPLDRYYGWEYEDSDSDQRWPILR